MGRSIWTSRNERLSNIVIIGMLYVEKDIVEIVEVKLSCWLRHVRRTGNGRLPKTGRYRKRIKEGKGEGRLTPE